MNRRQPLWLFVLVTVVVIGIAACQPAAAPPEATLIIPTAIIPVDVAGGDDPLPTPPPPVIVTHEPTAPAPTVVPPQPTAVATESPVVDPPPAPETSNYAVAYVLSNDVLNVRAGAGVDYDIVGTFAHDAGDVTITGSGIEVEGSTWVPVTDGRVQGWVNSRFLVETMAAAQFCEDESVRALLDELQTAVAARDNASLAQLIHPERGLRISYNWWNPAVLINGPARASLFSSDAVYDWGYHDGSGEPIDGSFATEIYPLLEKDLLGAAERGCNQILSGGTAGLVQLPEGYEAVDFISVYRPATDASGFDWGSWVIGIEKWNGRYYLSYLVHFAWEI